jgi:uncharacterized protein YbjT (DUF2867 family)
VSEPVLVFGATGSHGGAVAHALLGEGVPVHALVRDPSSDRARALAEAGAELVAGDLLDAGSLTGPLSAVAAAYAVTTPFEGGADEEVRQGEAIVAAAKEAALPWLVLGSVAAAARAPVPHFRSKARIEDLLRDSGVPWSVVAPSYFYENVLASHDALAAGELPIALPANTPLHQVALANLGAVVAAVLGRREEHLGERVEVAGDAPTPAEMAEALRVEYVEVPLERVRERSPDLAAMYGFLADEGYGIDVEAVRARYPEVPWISFADWAAGIELG